MSLVDCLNARGLGEHLCAGLRALGVNSKRVTVALPRKAAHSVALDDALRERFPQAPRWDYGVALERSDATEVAWIEVHTATSGEVDTVLTKLAWLKRWLANDQDACAAAGTSFHWVATDAGVHIDSERRRKLNAAGLEMPRSHLRL